MAQLEIATQKPYKYLFDFVIVGETGNSNLKIMKIKTI